MIKKIFFLLTRDASVTIINFLIIVLLARYLTINELAVWFSLQTVFLVCDAFFRFKSEVPFVVNYSSSEKDVIKTSQLIIILISIITLVSIYILFRKFSLNHLSELINYSIKFELDLILVSFILSVPATSYLYYLTAIKNYSTYNIVLFSQSLINLICILLGLQYFENVIYAPIIGQLVSWLFVALVAITNLKIINFRFCKKQFLIMLNSGLKFYLNSIIATLQQQTGRFYCLFLLSPNALAYFGQIQAIFSLFVKIPNALNTIILPEFSNRQQNHKIKEVLLYFVSAQVLITALFYLIGPFFILYLFGDKFIDIIPHFINLLPFVSLYCISIVIIGFQNSSKDFKSMNIIITTSFIIQLIFITLCEYSFDVLIKSMITFNLSFFLISLFYSKRLLR